MPFTNAAFANVEGSSVFVDDGLLTRHPVPADHPDLAGLEIAPFVPELGAPALRVRSVLPVAFRKAARATPAPGAKAGTSLLAAMLAQADEDAREAIEYAVRMERADLVEGGMPEALADAVLALAATYPGSDAVLEPIPPA